MTQLALPATAATGVIGEASAAGADVQSAEGLRVAFSGATSGSIAVWDLSEEQPNGHADSGQVS